MTKDQIKELSERLVEVFKKHADTNATKKVQPSELNKKELFCVIADKLKTLRTKIK